MSIPAICMDDIKFVWLLYHHGQNFNISAEGYGTNFMANFMAATGGKWLEHMPMGMTYNP